MTEIEIAEAVALQMELECKDCGSYDFHSAGVVQIGGSYDVLLECPRGHQRHVKISNRQIQRFIRENLA